MNRASSAIALAVAGAVLAAAGPAFANMGRRNFDGGRNGEPVGILDVAITHEELVLDLRPVATAGLCQVSATYHLDNRGDAKHLDLVFASGSGSLAGFEVTLDKQVITTRAVTGRDLPATWRTPSETPLPDGGAVSFEVERDGGTIAFTLDIPPGPHELHVGYGSTAMVHHGERPMLLHQFTYVLAPARTWAGFGGLDLRVLVPTDWTATITPPLPRTGDVLSASFATLPADAIALTISAPPGHYKLIQIACGVLFALVTFGGGYLVDRLARRRERARAERGEQLKGGAAAFAFAALWSSAFFAAGLVLIVVPSLAITDNQVDGRGYEKLLFAIIVAMASVVVFVVGIALGLRAARRGYQAALAAAAAAGAASPPTV